MIIMTSNFAYLFAVFSQLHHPNIVHFYGAGVPPNLFYVMELCQRSLFDLLHHCRRSIGTHERVKMAVRRQEQPKFYMEVSSTGKGMGNTKKIVGNHNQIGPQVYAVQLSTNTVTLSIAQSQYFDSNVFKGTAISLDDLGHFHIIVDRRGTIESMLHTPPFICTRGRPFRQY